MTLSTLDLRAATTTLRQRAAPRRSTARNARALFPPTTTTQSHTAAPSLTTFTGPQQFLQDVDDSETTDRALHGYRAPPDEREHDSSYSARASDVAVDMEGLLNELYELRESMGNDGARAISTVERRYLALLHRSIITTLTQNVLATTDEPHGSAGVKEACRALLTLCVKPTSLARAIAFSLAHALATSVAVQLAETSSSQTSNQLLSGLFACVNDMVVKSVAVASNSSSSSNAIGSIGSVDTGSIQSAEAQWIHHATACLLLFIRNSTGDYRTDRLLRLDTVTISTLLRRALVLSTVMAYETELQETLVEILLTALYAHHHNRAQGHTTHVTPGGVTLAEVERIGGVDLLLAVLYSSMVSDRTRRLVLVVLFDLALDQLKRTKSHDDTMDAWASYESLLRCLHECEFATLVATSPLTFVTTQAAVRHVQVLHAAVENELLEKHVAAVWSTLRSLLQVDEYFAESASLHHALKLVANAPPQSQPESIAELIVTKAHHLIVASTRVEDRFKGERWLAELLVHGLTTDASVDGPSSQHLFGQDAADDQLEESLCYDEAADIRLVARAKLWTLCRSPAEASRMAFARVLRLLTQRRVWLGAPPSQVAAHIHELNPCLDALVAQHEDSPAVILTVLDTLLRLVVPSFDVPYLDAQRLRYDAASSDAPQEPVGALLGSDSLAAKLLRGAVAVDRGHVAAISLLFLVHALTVLDAATRATVAANERVPASLVADYATATALLVSYALEDAPGTSLSTTNTLAAFLDAADTRVAVIAARSVVTQLKRDDGEQRYTEKVRRLHTAAVERDDEAPLANSFAHAHALFAIDGLTP